MTQIVFSPFARRPWIVEWKDIWCGERQEKAFFTEAEAKDFAKEQEIRLRQERAIQLGARKQTDPKKDRYTVNELLDMFIDSHTSERTKEGYIYHSKPIRQMFGTRMAHRMTRQDAETFSRVGSVRGLSEATIARRLGVLRAALNWAEREGHISHSAWSGLRVRKGHSREYPIPTVDQLAAVISVAPDRVVRTILLGLYTGCRIGPCELFRLQWKHVDIDNRTIYIPASRKSRSGSPFRAIPMRDDLVPALWSWRREDKERYPENDYVIHCRGRAVQSINPAWHKALADAGIVNYFRPYDLRHAFATLTMGAGKDAASVARVMGHVNTDMLMQTYLHFTRQIAEDTVTAVPGNLGRLIPIK